MHKGEETLIARQIKKTIQDVVDERCICKDRGVLTSQVEETKLDWKSYYQILLNPEFDKDEDNCLK